MRVLFCFIGLVGTFIFLISNSFAVQSLGIFGFKSVHGRYLQAHPDGELHASNENRNDEETWILVEIDKINQVYALQNLSTGNFISKQGNCARANIAS